MKSLAEKLLDIWNAASRKNGGMYYEIPYSEQMGGNRMAWSALAREVRRMVREAEAKAFAIGKRVSLPADRVDWIEQPKRRT